MTTPDRPLLGIGIRLAATALLTAMFALVKLVQERGVGLFEVLFFRQAIALIPVMALVLAGPGLASLKTARMPAHVSRTAVGMIGNVLNFASVALLPLAEAQTLWFTIPLFATILSAVVLREVVGVHRWSAIVAGFIGVLIVVQPQSGHLPPLGAAVGLAAAFTVGCVSILLRQLGRTEGALTTTFWFTLLSTVAFALPLPWVLQDHDGATWGMLLAMGLLGGVGQVALTASFRFAPVSVVAPVDYVSLLWSVALGILIFGESPTVWTWVGAPVIIGSGLYIVWREHRLRQSVAVPTPA